MSKDKSTDYGIEKLFFIVPYLFALVDILFINLILDLPQFVGVVVLILTVRKRDTLFRFITFSFLFLIPLAFVLNKAPIAEKAAVWVFYMLCYKLITLVINLRK